MWQELSSLLWRQSLWEVPEDLHHLGMAKLLPVVLRIPKRIGSTLILTFAVRFKSMSLTQVWALGYSRWQDSRQVLVNSNHLVFVFMYPFENLVFDLSGLFRWIVLFLCIVALGFFLFGNFYTSHAAQYGVCSRKNQWQWRLRSLLLLLRSQLFKLKTLFFLSRARHGKALQCFLGRSRRSLNLQRVSSNRDVPLWWFFNCLFFV